MGKVLRAVLEVTGVALLLLFAWPYTKCFDRYGKTRQRVAAGLWQVVLLLALELWVCGVM
jgi:hypothetical protein